ncbi:MAG: DUF1674 domain-containing protein [Rhodanobacteraceae bacterium]|nr:MAG: DUF1674 domain-containing protein [Rhodanobacteraceae bacterium]
MQTQTDASHPTTPAAEPPATGVHPATSRPVPPGGAGRDRPTPEGDGLDPTRYGDWEKNGRCIDF